MTPDATRPDVTRPDVSRPDVSRLDVALVSRGLAPSRARAQAQIEAGCVRVNGRETRRASQPVSPRDELTVVADACPYVSRGGLKLAHALRVFEVDPRGAVALDVGASTGGFTDVLLDRGAARVYALDVGHGQLHERLRADARVVNLEGVNARDIRRDMFDPPPTLGVTDVSFIPLSLALPPALRAVGEGEFIALVKPQFEVGPARVGKRGVVRDPAAHKDALLGVRALAESCGFVVRALAPSPIVGQLGNIEFLAHLMPARAARRVSDAAIDAAVRESHALHKETPKSQ